MEGSPLIHIGSAGDITGHLQDVLSGGPAELYRAASHLIIHGGKRLRPYMVLETCQMLGGQEKDAMAAAGAVEMVHNFSLVHDDIMDNDETRHGVPTTHEKYGMPLAILAGDTLFSQAYRTLLDCPLPGESRAALASSLAEACVDICEGQWMDISMGQDSAMPPPSTYIRMIRKKTSALFQVSCAMGAICARAGLGDIGAVSSFGLNLGTAFQITDDWIGIAGDPNITKKPVGNDIREGKKSLPILMAIRHAGEGDRQNIMKPFGNPGATTQETAAAVDAIRSMGIDDKVRSEAASYADAARHSLETYSGPHRDNLESLLDFVVERRL